MTDIKSIPRWQMGRRLRAAREVEAALRDFGRLVDRTISGLPGQQVPAQPGKESTGHGGFFATPEHT